MLKRDHRFGPLYYQVEHVIRQRIATGEYAPGAQIPSENDLSREMGVSRVTIREALRELVTENTLLTVQGKGTFVSKNRPISGPKMKFVGSLEELYDQIVKVSVKDVELSRVPMTDELRKQLKLGPGQNELVRIKRLRLESGAPYALTINFLPVEIGDSISEADLYKTPLVRILEQKLKIPITRAHETVEAIAADPTIAERLEVVALSPVVHVKRIMYTKKDKPIEVVESYYRSDRYRYSVDLIRITHEGKRSWIANLPREQP
jgi:GntR family transcriptional regulator